VDFVAGIELTSVVRRFAESRCSWLSTVRPDGGAHATPIWHVFHDGCVFLVTMPNAVKVRNIRCNPGVVITHPDPMNVIIVEGTARLVEEMTDALRPHFRSKYDWDIAADEDYRTIIEIRPTKILAWDEDGADDPGRWTSADLSDLLLSAPPGTTKR
jgi:general stress protein 26